MGVFLLILCILFVVGLLIGEDSRGVGIAIFILLTLGLIEWGSNGEFKLFTYFINGIKNFITYAAKN